MALAASRFTRLLPLIVVSAVPMLAQGVSAQLSGVVLTKDGAAIEGASVAIRNTETGFSRVIRTDAKGRYLAAILPVGPYTVSVTKDGFQTATGLKVNLNLGDAAPLNIRLATVGGATVEVVATGVQVDSERASTATIVSPDALANLPVFNRSFTSLATLTPQVIVADRGNLAIGGQRGINTSINIDGGDTNEPFFGGAMGAAEGKTPFTISIEAIREYQVVTDGASAEFGRMGGGYVNAITKNGGNEIAGSVFFYKRPQSMVARGANLNGVPDSNKVGDFKQDQFGFSVGGPIIKDKLFYFVTYDGQRKTDPVNFIFGGNQPVALDPTVPGQANDAALLSRGQSYDPKSDSDTLFVRFDWNVSTDHQVQFRINRSDFRGDAYTASGTYLNTYENTISDDIKTLGLVGQWNWTINNSLLNEVRVNYGKDEMPRKTRASIPMVTVNRVGIYGANQYPRDYETTRLQLTESLAYVTPVFQIKAGVDFNRIDVAETFASTWQGAYYFSNLGNFRQGNWTDYNQRFSLNPNLSGWEAGKFDATEDQIAAYVQSDLRIGNDIKVGLGLRWDYQTHPDFPIANFGNKLATTMPVNAKVPTDSQISPRLSFTWTPSFDRSVVVRGSAGRYVSTTPSVFLYQAYTLNGERMAAIRFTAEAGSLVRGATWDANNPYVFPDYATAVAAGGAAARTDIFSFSPDFTNPHTDRANIQIERGFDFGWVFGLSAAYAKSAHLERLKDLNQNPTVLNATNNRWSIVGARPNASYQRMAMYVSDAQGLYHAYTASAKYQKDDSPFYAQVFYTYAIDKDNDSNERNFSGYTQQNTQRLGDDWGYSDRDRTHALTGAVSYHERRWSGIQAGVSFRYVSGTPYSMIYGRDMNGDGVNNDRLFRDGVDTGRNTQRRSSNTTIDLKLSRDFKLYKRIRLAVSAEVFNLLNRHDTYLYERVDSGSTDAIPLTSTSLSEIGSARQVQLGAKLSF